MTSHAQPAGPHGIVLVLGATGIIGRELVTAASHRGFDVVGISRRPRASAEPRITYLAIDGYDTAALRASLDGLRFVAVIDLLSFTADTLEKSLRTLAAQCDQYIFFSSATVYASAGADSSITEDWPRVEAGWSYPLEKIQCEHKLRAVCAEIDVDYTIVRPYITYSDQRIPFGPWEMDEVFGRLGDRRPIVLGDEIARARTSVTDSRDLARATLLLVRNPAAINEDFHIASPETRTWAEVYATAGELMGVQPWIVSAPTDTILRHFPHLSGKISDRVLNRSFDNSKLISACPGFTFEYSIRDGFAAAVSTHQRPGTRRPASRVAGRIDRMIAAGAADLSIRQERRRYAKTLLRQSVSDYLRYETEFRPWLQMSQNALRRWRNTLVRGAAKESRSNYA